MVNETSDKPIEQIQKLEQYLPDEKKAELAQILNYGKEIKERGENLKEKFWEEHQKNLFVSLIREDFLNLLLQYQENDKKFMESLDTEGQKIIGGMKGVQRDKFFEEYLYDCILYSGNTDCNFEKKVISCDRNGDIESFVEKNKDKLQPWMNVNLSDIDISLIGLMTLVQKWKGKLEQGMYINLYKNYIGDEGIEIIARGWKDSLQPGIMLNLGRNNIGYDGIRVLVDEWKENLQPGLALELSDNKFGLEGLEYLVNGWKDKLQPGMALDFRRNQIGDEGVKTIVEMEFKDGMTLDLRSNSGITNDGKKILKQCEEKYNNQGIHCRILFDE